MKNTEDTFTIEVILMYVILLIMYLCMFFDFIGAITLNDNIWDLFSN